MGDNVFEGIQKASIKLPLEILKEYETQFEETFGQKLVFQIASKLEDDNEDWLKLDPFKSVREPAEQKHVSRVYIVAPSLKNYRMLIMKISYLRSKVYPCEMYNALTETNASYESSDTLDVAIKQLFLSEEFKKPMGVLLSQIELP